MTQDFIDWREIEALPEYLKLDLPVRQKIRAKWFEKNLAPTEAYQSLDEGKKRAVFEKFNSDAEARETYAKAPDTRGFGADLGSSFLRGTARAAGNIGSALSMADLTPTEEETEPGFLDRTGKALTDWSKSATENPALIPSKAEQRGEYGLIRRGIMGGIESVPMSAAPFAAGIAAGMAGGPILGTAAGTGTLFATFGLGTYGEEYSRVREELDRTRPDMPEDEKKTVAHTAAFGNAGFEVGTEIISDAVALVTFGGSKVFTQPIKATLKNLAGQSAKELLKSGVKTTGVETASEMVAGGGQNWVLQSQGLIGGTIAEGVVESIIPSLTMSLFIGVGGAGFNKVQANNLLKSLNSEDTETRIKAVDFMAQRIAQNTKDESLASLWKSGAYSVVDSGAKFDVNEKIVDFASVKLTEDLAALEEKADINKAETVDDAVSGFKAKVEQGKPPVKSEFPFAPDRLLYDAAKPLTPEALSAVQFADPMTIANREDRGPRVAPSRTAAEPPIVAPEVAPQINQDIPLPNEEGVDAPIIEPAQDTTEAPRAPINLAPPDAASPIKQPSNKPVMQNQELTPTIDGPDAGVSNKIAALPEEIKPDVPSVKPGTVKGKAGVAYTQKNDPVPFVYAVVPAESLNVSHDLEYHRNDLYPQELQPRDRDRSALRLQVEQIANTINPARLSASPGVSSGAPIVGDDLVVESGNGRSIALKKAFASGKGEGYRQFLIDNAQDFGIKARDIKAIKNPVLVRVRTSNLDRVQFSKDANQEDISRMSPLEQAISDSSYMTDADMDLFKPSDDGSISSYANRAFIKRFLGKLGGNESAGMVTDSGEITKTGLDRIQAAVFAKAYADKNIISIQAEDANPDIKNILNALNIAAGEFAKARAAGEDFNSLDITSDIVAAAKIVQRSRRENISVDQIVKQREMFSKRSKESEDLAQFFDQNIRSGKRMGEALKKMAELIKNDLQNRNQLDIFGKKKTLSKQEAIQRGIDHATEAQNSSQRQTELFKGSTDQSRGTRKPDRERRASSENTEVLVEGPGGINEQVDSFGTVLEKPTQLSFEFGAPPRKRAENSHAPSLSGPPRARMVSTGDISYSGNVVRDTSDVAALLAHIRKSAQEEVFTVTTDRNGLVLEIHKVSKGTTNAASINPLDMAGPILAIKNAKTTYFVHNHPSGAYDGPTGLEGSTVASKNDVLISRKLASILKLRGIGTKSIIIVSDKYIEFDRAGAEKPPQHIRPTIRKIKLPVKERKLFGKRSRVVDKANNPAVAARLIAERYGNKNGILLLNAKRAATGFIEWPAGTGTAEATAGILSEIEKTSASGVIINLDKVTPERAAFIRDLSEATTGDIQVLDVFENGQSMTGEGRAPVRRAITANDAISAMNRIVAKRNEPLYSTKPLDTTGKAGENSPMTSKEGPGITTENKPQKPEGGKRIYRAANDDYISQGYTFSEDIDAAREYLDNPNFGGDTLYESTIPSSHKILDLSDTESAWETLSEIYGKEITPDMGQYEISQAVQIIPNLLDSINDAGYDWVKYVDDFPKGSISYTVVSDKAESHLSDDNLTEYETPNPSSSPGQGEQYSTKLFKGAKDGLFLSEGRNATEHEGVVDARSDFIRIFEKEYGPGVRTKTTFPRLFLKARRNIAQVCKEFGLTPIFFKSEQRELAGANGIVLPSRPDVIFINVNSDTPWLAVVGHELLHTLQYRHPEIYKALHKALTANVKDFDAYYAKLTRDRAASGHPDIDRHGAFTELIADFTGDQLQNPEFYMRLLKQDQPLALRLIDIVKKLLHQIDTAIRKTFGVEKHFKDIDKARDAIAIALSGYRKLSGEMGATGKSEMPLFTSKEAAFSTKTAETQREITKETLTLAENLKSLLKKPVLDGTTKKDFNYLTDLVLGSPAFFAKKIGAAERMFQSTLTKQSDMHEFMEQLSNHDDVNVITVGKALAKEDKPGYQKVKKYLLDADRYGGFKIGQEKKDWIVKDAKGTVVFRTESREMPSGVDVGEVIALDEMRKLEDGHLEGLGFTDQQRAYVDAVRKTTNKGFELLVEGLRKLRAEAKRAGLPEPTIPIYEKDGVTQVSLNKAIAMINDQRGAYFPRIHEKGRYVLIAAKPGEPKIRETFTFSRLMERSRAEYEKNGYTVTTGKAKNVGEDVFDLEGSLIKTQQFLNAALEKVGKGEYVSDEAMNLFASAIGEQIANVIRQRGTRGFMTKRSDELYLGYEEDPNTAISQYIVSIAGGESKRIMVGKLMAAFTGTDISFQELSEVINYQGGYEDYISDERRNPEITKEFFEKHNDPGRAIENETAIADAREMLKTETDESAIKALNKTIKDLTDYEKNEHKKLVKERMIDQTTQPTAFKWGKAYISEVTRNAEPADKVIGFFRNLAVMKFLATRVFAAPLVNLTALPTSVIAGLNGAGIPYRKTWGLLAAGIRDYGKFLTGKPLSEDSKFIFDYMKQKGWDSPQFSSEALMHLRGSFGRVLDKAIEYGMLTFSWSEKLNRAATFAAGFNGLKKLHPDKNNTELAEMARQISDDSHGIYHKGNLPYLALGGNPAAQVARMFYVFRVFSHTYMQHMFKLGFKNKAALAHMLVAPAVIAGAGASVLTPVISALLKGLGLSDEPEEELYRNISEAFGPNAERFVRLGAAGLAGINMKGSLSVGIADLPTTTADLLGAPGSVVTDFWQGSKFLVRGDAEKGFEKILPSGFGNLIKANREYRDGITNTTNAPVFFGKEQLKPTLAETIFKGASFNPARISSIRETQWSEKQIDQKYSQKKADIYAKLKKFYSQPNRTREKYLPIMEEIQEFNNKTKRYQWISPITSKSIKRYLRRTLRPSKRERLREE